MLTTQQIEQLHQSVIDIHNTPIENNHFRPFLKDIEFLSKEVNQKSIDLIQNIKNQDLENAFLLKDLFNLLFLDYLEDKTNKNNLKNKEIRYLRMTFKSEISEFLGHDGRYRQGLKSISFGDVVFIYKHHRAHNENQPIAAIIPDPNTNFKTKILFCMKGGNTLISLIEDDTIINTTLIEESCSFNELTDNYNLYSLFINSNKNDFVSFTKNNDNVFQKSVYLENYENHTGVFEVFNIDGGLILYGVENDTILLESTIVFTNEKNLNYNKLFNGFFELNLCHAPDSIFEILDDIMETKKSFKNKGKDFSSFAFYSLHEMKYLDEALELIELNNSF